MIKRLFLLSLLILMPHLANAESLYVSQSGSGDGTSCGSPRSASWFNTSANWGGGAGEIDPGDTVYLCGTITSDLTMQASGTSGNVITVDGTSATLGTTMTINNSGRSYWKWQNLTWATGHLDYCMSINGGTQMVVDGVTVPDPLFQNQQAGVFRVQGGLSYLTLRNVTVTNADSTGSNGGMIVNHYSSAYNTNMVFENFDITTSSNYRGNTARDIHYGTSTDGLIIQGWKVLYRWQGNGPDTGGGQPHNDVWQFGHYSGGNPPYVRNITIRYNYVIMDIHGTPSQTDAIIMDNAHDGYKDVYGNIFENRGSVIGYGMLHLGRKTPSNSSSATVRFYNNTVIDRGTTSTSTYNILYHGYYGHSQDYQYVRNNIFYSANTGTQTIIGWGSGTKVHDYNNFRGGTSYGGTTCASFASANENCNSTPGFLDYANKDYRIGASGPAYNTGTDLGQDYSTGLSSAYYTFPDPVTVVRTTPWDRGAFEVTAEAIQPTVSVIWVD